jgi:hypothetical protein
VEVINWADVLDVTKKRKMNVEQSHGPTLTTYAHLVAKCGLGIGLAAGKCFTDWISEQGIDVSHEPRGDGVAAKAGEVSFEIQNMCAFSSAPRNLRGSTTLLKLNQNR